MVKFYKSSIESETPSTITVVAASATRAIKLIYAHFAKCGYVGLPVEI